MERFEGNGRGIAICGDRVEFYQVKSIIGKIDELAGSMGSNTVPVSEITSVQCKKASVFSNGFVKLSINGVSSLETTVFFMPKKGKYEEAVEFTKKLQELMMKSKNKSSGALSSADEIKKYKDLLDAGIITQEEFDAKKKELLGL